MSKSSEHSRQGYEEARSGGDELDLPAASQLIEAAGPPSAPDSKAKPTADAPLLRSGKRRALRAYAKEQRDLFVQAWSMMLGWAAGDVVIALMDEWTSTGAEAALFALAASSICVAIALGCQRLAQKRPGTFAGMLLSLGSNSGGVMLGRAWNEAIARSLPDGSLKLLWQVLEAVGATVIAVTVSRVPLEAKLGQPMNDLIVKVLGMIVAWGWNDSAQDGLDELKGTDLSFFARVYGEIIYAVCVTAVACVCAAMISRLSKIAVAVWGLACGYAWKTVFYSMLYKESWAPLSLPPDTLGEVAWLLLFATTMTVVLSAGTCVIRRRVESDQAAVADGEISAGPRVNAAFLFVLISSLNVAWAWGDTFKGLFNLTMPGDWGATVGGKLVYFSIVSVLAPTFLWLHSKGALINDQSYGDAGD